MSQPTGDFWDVVGRKEVSYVLLAGIREKTSASAPTLRALDKFETPILMTYIHRVKNVFPELLEAYRIKFLKEFHRRSTLPTCLTNIIGGYL